MARSLPSTPFILLFVYACFLLVSSVSARQQFREDEPIEPADGWRWGSIDANIDWCERNYDTTTYMAEFWNAISSLPIFAFALAGYMAGRRYAMAETRFSLAFCMVMMVGIGSFMFHATLRRYAQALDELPMLWTSIALFYNAVDHAPDVHDPAWIHPALDMNRHNPNGNVTRAPPRQAAKHLPFLPNHPLFHKAPLKLALVFSGIFLTTIYFYIPGLFVIFFVGYSSFLVSFVAIMAYHIFYSSRAERKNRSNAGYESVPLDQIRIANGEENGNGSSSVGINPNQSGVMLSAENASIVTRRPYTPILGKLFWGAIAGYFGGFVFWMYENNFCSTLPPYIQLHAVWHIMAGLGSFCTIQCQLAWRGEELGGRTAVDMKLGANILPIVVIKYTQSE